MGRTVHYPDTPCSGGITLLLAPIPVAGAFLITLNPIQDNRGFFSRSYCKQEFLDNGIEMDIVQCNISHNKTKGTVRGMHYQECPHEEQKIVSCIQGSIYDVVLDLRKESPTYLKWHAETLSAESMNALFIPKGCAHGFQTLTDNCRVYYQMGNYYHPQSARGVRWNDPVFGISWPDPADTISDKDTSYQDFSP